MPSTVYKGDLSEVSFGHESGIVLTHAHHHSGLSWTHADTGDTSVITLAGASATGHMWSGTGILKYPEGLLVGCTMRIISKSGNNHENDDYGKTGRIFTIIANSNNTITVTPALTSSGASQTDDSIVIDSLGCPAIDANMGGWNTRPDASDETVLTDQFVGLAATITLPETKVELLRNHVVGIGRDVVIQVPQKFSNEGGSMEMMLNSARWMYYALGNEATASCNGNAGKVEIDNAGGNAAKAISMGDNYIEFSKAVSGTMPNVGDYIQVLDVTPTLIPTSHADPAAGTLWTGAQTDFTRTETNEIRRVVAVDETVTAERRIYVDDPFCFDHPAGCTILGLEFNDAAGLGSPHFDTTAAAYGTITNRTSRVLFSGWHTPSFSLEASMRTRDVGSYNASGGTATNAPNSATDSKQLTRIWKGCKVKDWAITADADAEAKLSINFDALHCYTDTGRLEATGPGDRYTAHRMFENTGAGLAERKAAGIAPNTEKPFMFYNGTITAFGQPLAQVTNFNLTGNNNTVAHYTVRGNPLQENRVTGLHAGKSKEQIPFGGSRNAALLVEGKTEYELSMAVIVDDPLLWHEFRTNREHDHTEPIILSLTKSGAGTSREEIHVIIDDYILVEAPLPIPDDKGVVKSEMKIMPKHVKVVAHDALLHC